jgi:hypothetical protein
VSLSVVLFEVFMGKYPFMYYGECVISYATERLLI